MIMNSAKYQYYMAIGVNMSMVFYGISLGWPSPTFPLLESNKTSVLSTPLSPESLSWVASIICLGGLTGTLLFGYIVDLIDRRMSLLLLAILNGLSFTLILLAQNFYYLLAARFLGGLTGGGVFVLLPLYIGEISDDGIRGSLSSKLLLSCNAGMLFAYIIGNYCSYKIAASIYVGLQLLYIIPIIKLPETPPYYLIKVLNKKVEEYMAELECLKYPNKSKCANVESERITYKDFVTRSAVKAMGIGIGLLVLNQGCGCYAMLNYTATILNEGGSILSPNMSAIIVGVIQLIGSYISIISIDKMGRKVCMATSSFGTCIGLLVMATYYNLKIYYDMTELLWIPIVSFSFTILIATWGVLTLPFIVLAEITPEKIRPTAVSIAMVIFWVLGFISFKYIYQLFNQFNLHGTFYIFAAISLLGTLFVIFCVPETQGKSWDEIQQLL